MLTGPPDLCGNGSYTNNCTYKVTQEVNLLCQRLRSLLDHKEASHKEEDLIYEGTHIDMGKEGKEI